MFRTAPSSALPLSHIIAPDAPLLSPTPAEQLLEPAAAALFAADPSFTYEPYPPPFAFDAPALKLRASPDSPPTPDEACVATHQLFGDFSPAECASPAPDAFDDDCAGSRAASPSPLSGPSRTPARKPHRVSTKDFIPPDVTGLSKREARLVKNRAAAFLSRQRKREEFELMEVRVAELEQENALLRGASHTLPAATAAAGAPDEALSEIEQLRAQLAAAERQTAALSAQLQQAAAPVVKAEPVDVVMPSHSQAASPAPARSRSSSVSSQKPERSGASLGLMVLLCALPTLLSMPTQSALPARLSMPSSALAHRPTHSLSAFDPLQFLPAETDLAGLMDMDMDMDLGGLSAERDMFFSLPTPAPASPAASLFGGSSDEHPAEPATRTLAFADGDKLGLGALDISFDAVPAHDGKIRVRIHPGGAGAHSAASSRGASPFPAMPGAFSPEPDAHLGPWLGVADERPFDSRASFGSAGDAFDARASFGSLDSFDGLDFGRASPAPAPRRRVRIALKSVPAPGGEGGEWEVELC